MQQWCARNEIQRCRSMYFTACACRIVCQLLQKHWRLRHSMQESILHGRRAQQYSTDGVVGRYYLCHMQHVCDSDIFGAWMEKVQVSCQNAVVHQHLFSDQLDWMVHAILAGAEREYCVPQRWYAAPFWAQCWREYLMLSLVCFDLLLSHGGYGLVRPFDICLAQANQRPRLVRPSIFSLFPINLSIYISFCSR